jgi:hypothetical protein
MNSQGIRIIPDKILLLIAFLEGVSVLGIE